MAFLGILPLKISFQSSNPTVAYDLRIPVYTSSYAKRANYYWTGDTRECILDENDNEYGFSTSTLKRVPIVSNKLLSSNNYVTSFGSYLYNEDLSVSLGSLYLENIESSYNPKFQGSSFGTSFGRNDGNVDLYNETVGIIGVVTSDGYFLFHILSTCNYSGRDANNNLTGMEGTIEATVTQNITATGNGIGYANFTSHITNSTGLSTSVYFRVYGESPMGLMPYGYGASTWNEVKSNINPIFPTNPDPYSPGGNTGTEGNSEDTGGTWSTTHSGLAVGSSDFNDLEAELFRAYALDKNQLSDFSRALWNPNILEAVLQKIGGIEKLVIGLFSFPFELINNPNQTPININFNWMDEWNGTGAKGYILNNEERDIPFGQIEIPRFSKTFYDYQPYSSAQLFLPYVGFVPLKMNEIVGCKLDVIYTVNIMTGDFCAKVSVIDKHDPLTDTDYDMTIGMYNGNMARPLPLSRQELFDVYKAGATLLGATAGALIGGMGAASAAMSGNKAVKNYEAINKQVNSINQTAIRMNDDLLRNGNPMNLPLAPMVKAPDRPDTKLQEEQIKSGVRTASDNASNAIGAVANANAPISRSGNLGGVVGRCSHPRAFILLSYPHQNVSANQNILGYATNIEGPLKKFKGYTEVREIRIKDSNATSSEISEIEQIVRGGIII